MSPEGHALPHGGAARRSIIALCCRECAYAAADTAANMRMQLPPSVRVVLVPCTGRLSPLHLIGALAHGADGVVVAGCLKGQCHYREGNLSAIDRVTFAQHLLEAVGVERDRVQMITTSAGEPQRLAAALREMDRAVGALPPLSRS